MAVTRYKREQQTRLFAQRMFDRQENAKLITKETNRIVDEAIAEGKSPDEIKDIFRVEARKAKNYAMTAAVTDATRIENVAREDAYKQISDMGILIIKTWLTTMDGRQRESHDAINKEEQFIDDKFSIGGMYPGDPKLPPQERYGCRCRTLPEVLGVDKLTAENKAKFISKINQLSNRILNKL